METIYTDLLSIGAGLAGERVAIEAAQAGFTTICLSLVPPRRSHSSAAQGGMQAALGNCAMGEGDCPDIHFTDTVKGSDWGCDQEVARMFVEHAPVVMRELAHWGVPWNRVVPGPSTYFKGGEQFEKVEPEARQGLITARSFGGTAKWRTCYTSDGTGHAVLYTMDNRAVQLGVEVHDRTEALALIHDGERCMGAVVRCLRTGTLRIYLARATLVASGGYGRIYKHSTNAVICEGGGQALTLDTGVVPLGNMEAIQFHPTGTVPTDILVTEGCRGDGGTLLDVNGHRFMPDYEPEKAELASRDVVSRRMIEHIRRGYGVPSSYGDHLWLDIRHLGETHITTKLREVYDICRHFLGVNPVHACIPVRPTQHYSMGGIRTDKTGHAYGLKGLFAAGEAACWDLHGFNRLGGNSLAETVVAGSLIGSEITRFLQGDRGHLVPQLGQECAKQVQQRIRTVQTRTNGENVFQLRNAMQNVLMEKVGIFREEPELQAALDRLLELSERAAQIGLRNHGAGACPELALALRFPGMLRLAVCTTYGALQRKESRGAHAREDYPARNDREWWNRTLATWTEEHELPSLEYEPATSAVEIPPGDRGYGGGEIISGDDVCTPRDPV
ncbi:fumarate reductase flavoprotein subunit [Desulfohalobium retbaense]|uniref:succinate dehydrogenase n=1 Tax=Desulfohalobium retbaense (strain ATCC 49708 / DSM 5692 / JCM 16813 / HR100) TaxID=485915 RepID=C8X231_DESRD|nr:fumarate reductase flavoprotein subunit [Desulfohalobium retbaense]ACV68354.1 succinate dehydrogenase or fumarate reductase, flavoprotein subunit [Desulfohalobium retbaense DSM 5692]